MKRLIFVGLGANIPGKAGSVLTELRQTAASLASIGCQIKGVSSVYITAPVGGGRQPLYLNAVLAVTAPFTPLGLLRLAKAIEHRAGRRRGPRNGPRPLDLDILDYGGRVLGPGAHTRRPRLVLPHPFLHRRAFALVPLLEIAPAWQHPRLRCSGRALLERLPPGSGAVQRILDSDWISCDQQRLTTGAPGGSLRLSARRQSIRLPGLGMSGIGASCNGGKIESDPLDGR